MKEVYNKIETNAFSLFPLTDESKATMIATPGICEIDLRQPVTLPDLTADYLRELAIMKLEDELCIDVPESFLGAIHYYLILTFPMDNFTILEEVELAASIDFVSGWEQQNCPEVEEWLALLDGAEAKELNRRFEAEAALQMELTAEEAAYICDLCSILK